MRNAILSAGEAAEAANVSDHDHWSFGPGRCICRGMHLAERALPLVIVQIPRWFEIGKKGLRWRRKCGSSRTM